jgi:hypothetical protein
MPGQGTQTMSTDDPTNPMSQALAPLLDKPFQVKMDARGKVTEITGLDALLASLLDKPGMSQFTQAFGSDALKQNIENTTALFPDHPVAEGDSWVQEIAQNVGMPVKMKTTYTFRGIEEGDWKITAASTVEVPGGTIEMNGMQVKCDLAGTSTSEFRLDKATGWITNGKMTMNMKGTIQIPGNEQMPNGMSIKMDVASTSTITGSVKK